MANLEPVGPPTVPTQVANPWRATWRTVVQVGLPSFFLLLAVLPAILESIVEGLGGVLPPEALGWCAGAAAAITALAGTLARIAAIPGVNAWLATVGLDAGGGAHSLRR